MQVEEGGENRHRGRRQHGQERPDDPPHGQDAAIEALMGMVSGHHRSVPSQISGAALLGGLWRTQFVRLPGRRRLSILRLMNTHPCPDCGEASARITDVVTSAELLAALIERSERADLAFEPRGSEEESLVYTLRCGLCDWQSLRSTQRVKLVEDPEPIG